MTQVRVILEYTGQGSTQPVVRWERMAAGGGEGEEGKVAAFELLGRAFEVAQREESAGFREAMEAFFRGAMIRKQDLIEIAGEMDEA